MKFNEISWNFKKMQLLRPPSEMDHGLVKFGGFWGTWTRKSENGWDFTKFRKIPEISVFAEIHGNSRFRGPEIRGTSIWDPPPPD